MRKWPPLFDFSISFPSFTISFELTLVRVVLMILVLCDAASEIFGQVNGAMSSRAKPPKPPKR